MKNQRGSAVIWIILSLIILIVAGVAYWYWSQNPTSTTAVLTQQENPSSQTNATGTFNQSTLTTSSLQPTISGTATGASFVRILLSEGNYNTVYVSNATAVINSQWSVTVQPPQGGRYQITLWPCGDNKCDNPGGLLASSTLIVSAGQPSATIDQRSLSQEVSQYDGQPIITGSGSNTTGVDIYVNGVNATFAPVNNGHWSATIPDKKFTFSSGSTWSIEVHQHDTGALLTSGTLTITGTYNQ